MDLRIRHYVSIRPLVGYNPYSEPEHVYLGLGVIDECYSLIDDPRFPYRLLAVGGSYIKTALWAVHMARQMRRGDDVTASFQGFIRDPYVEDIWSLKHRLQKGAIADLR